MKAISLLQPWASLVAVGAKKIETRSWPTKHRGLLAIHAAKAVHKDAKWAFFRYPITETLKNAGYSWLSNLPFGAVLAIANLVDCREITIDNIPPEPEYSFGNYSEGRYAWILKDIKPLPEPIPAKGQLGLWNWEPPGGILL